MRAQVLAEGIDIRKRRLAGYLAGFIAGVSYGTNPLFAKPLLESGVPVLVMLFFRYGTSDSRKAWFNVGDYKKLPNEVGGNATCSPEEVHQRMKELLVYYNTKKVKTLRDIVDLHQKFESIHPFQDGNGRVGRLVMFKECLANDIVPFIITEELKLFYYRGLREWGQVDGYLMDTCLTAQDHYKKLLEYFKIKYHE